MLGEEDGTTYLYVSGKTDSDIRNLCADPDSFPSRTSGNSTNGLVIQIDLESFTVSDCLAIQSENDRFEEISTLEWDEADNVLWVGGSTKGDLVAGSRIDGNEEGGEESSSDVYVARISSSLDEDPLFLQFGSVDFDETLGSDWDPETATFYIAGSSMGNVCDAYPELSSSLDISCSDGQGGNYGDNFDAFLAAVSFASPSTLTPQWIWQFGEGDGGGSDDADVAHDVEIWVDGDGGRYLYENGYRPGGLAADGRVGRIALGMDGLPVTEAGTVLHPTVTVADPSGYGDSAGTLLLGDVYLWVTLTMHGGEDHAHGGPCGQGPTSNNEGHLQGYAHGGFDEGVAPDVDHTWIVTDGPEDQRSTTFEGVSYGDGALWVSGNTTAEPGTGHCGEQTTKDYDDENDAAVYRVVPVDF